MSFTRDEVVISGPITPGRSSTVKLTVLRTFRNDPAVYLEPGAHGVRDVMLAVNQTLSQAGINADTELIQPTDFSHKGIASYFEARLEADVRNNLACVSRTPVRDPSSCKCLTSDRNDYEKNAAPPTCAVPSVKPGFIRNVLQDNQWVAYVEKDDRIMGLIAFDVYKPTIMSYTIGTERTGGVKTKPAKPLYVYIDLICRHALSYNHTTSKYYFDNAVAVGPMLWATVDAMASVCRAAAIQLSSVDSVVAATKKDCQNRENTYSELNSYYEKKGFLASNTCGLGAKLGKTNTDDDDSSSDPDDDDDLVTMTKCLTVDSGSLLSRLDGGKNPDDYVTAAVVVQDRRAASGNAPMMYILLKYNPSKNLEMLVRDKRTDAPYQMFPVKKSSRCNVRNVDCWAGIHTGNVYNEDLAYEDYTYALTQKDILDMDGLQQYAIVEDAELVVSNS